MSAPSLPRAVSVAIAATAALALVLQFALVWQNKRAMGEGLAQALVLYLGYFTILSNAVVMLAFALPLLAPRSAAGRWAAGAAGRTGVALWIGVVMLVYEAVLRRLWAPEGAQWLADLLLHNAVPAMTLAAWWYTGPYRVLRWRHALAWLAWPGLYLVYALMRGSLTGLYPYPFIELGTIGLQRTLGNAGVLLLVFGGLGLALVAVDKARSRRVSRPETPAATARR